MKISNGKFHEDFSTRNLSLILQTFFHVAMNKSFIKSALFKLLKFIFMSNFPSDFVTIKNGSNSQTLNVLSRVKLCCKWHYQENFYPNCLPKKRESIMEIIRHFLSETSLIHEAFNSRDTCARWR